MSAAQRTHSNTEEIVMLLKKTLFAAATAVLATVAAGVVHAAPEKPECIAPA